MYSRLSLVCITVLLPAVFVDALETTSTTLFSTTASLASEPTSTSTSICGKHDLGNGKCGWVSGSSTRSTYSIIWSCLAVIILCTYKVIHPNVCSEEEHVASWREWPFWRKKLRRIEYMSIAVMAPEIIFSLAHGDWSASKYIRKNMARKRYSCSMVLAQFVCMGGLAVESSRGPIFISPEAFLVLLEDSDHIDAIVQQLPSDRDILDRSKTDSLTIALACFQSVWLVVQCIARKAQGYEKSELELSTCGFVMCSVITYGLWWDKPHDVEHRTLIHMPKTQEAESLISRAADSISSNQNYEEQRLGFTKLTATATDNTYTTFGYRSNIITIILGIMLSGVHLAAWAWEFPSHAELYLWRAANLVMLGSCLLFLASNLTGIPEYLAQGFMILGVLIYVSSRVIVIVQIFLCFRAMPESVYRDVAWTQFIPHLS